jgi:hypothetical protein
MHVRRRRRGTIGRVNLSGWDCLMQKMRADAFVTSDALAFSCLARVRIAPFLLKITGLECKESLLIDLNALDTQHADLHSLSTNLA